MCDASLSAFLRLPVADVVEPQKRSLVVGDLLCLSVPLVAVSPWMKSPVWSSDSSAVSVLDRATGAAIAMGAGQVMVTFGSVDMLNATTYAKVGEAG
jgi:hypothetical protein